MTRTETAGAGARAAKARATRGEVAETVALTTLIREEFGVMRTPVVTFAVWQWFVAISARNGEVPSLNQYAHRWLLSRRTAARHAGYMRELFGENWREVVPPLVAKVKTGNLAAPSMFVGSLALVATRRSK